jgi:hypothetical protein
MGKRLELSGIRVKAQREIVRSSDEKPSANCGHHPLSLCVAVEISGMGS